MPVLHNAFAVVQTKQAMITLQEMAIKQKNNLSRTPCFLQVFCTSLNGNTYGTKYRLPGGKSAGLG